MTYIKKLEPKSSLLLCKKQTGTDMAKKTKLVSMRIDDNMVEFLKAMAEAKKVKFQLSTEAYNLMTIGMNHLLEENHNIKEKIKSVEIQENYTLNISVRQGKIKTTLNKENKNENN